MKLLAALIALATLASCDIEIRDRNPHADHRIVSWSQTDLGGGVWDDVFASWEIENTGDVSASVSMAIHATTSDGTYSASVAPGRIKAGVVLTGTLVIPTEGKQATAVTVGHTMPNETEPW